MISLNIKEIATDIKNITLQGASKIELAAINGILNYIKETKLNDSEFINELVENINHLIKQRINEPKLRNSLNYVLNKAKKYPSKEYRKKLILEIEKYEENTIQSNKRISELGSELISEGSIILTHCHSNLVEQALINAHKRGIKFKVYNCETRPRYQGRITSKKLVDAGLDVTMITDASTTHILKKADLFLTGADVVFADGSVINKVGTYQISITAQYFKTPHIILTSTNCCESNLLLNLKETVEQRDINEVWSKENGRPDSLKIENPAFDVIPNELIDKFITEEGIFSAETLYLWVTKDSKKN
jgi:ribose 1,5-bisphosphate isomerase